MFRTVQTDADKDTLQNEKWQILFNFGKCKCIHLGHGNVNKEYFMGDTILGISVQKRTWELQLVLI